MITDELSTLAEPIRARILRLLEREELQVGELARVLQLPQPTVSRHLKRLLQQGWVLRRSEGTAHWVRAGDLGEGAALWEVVRERMAWPEDLPRLQAVLDQRRVDSSTFFGLHAEQWDALRAQLFGRSYALPTLLALLDPQLSVADLGCGTGEICALLAPRVRQVVGVDREQAMLAAARRRCAELPNVELHQGGLEALPLEDASVDLALCMLVLHHLEEPLTALREARRVVRRGLVLLDMENHQREAWTHTMGHRWLGFETEQLQAWAQEAGFASCTVQSLPPDPEADGPRLFVARLQVA